MTVNYFRQIKNETVERISVAYDSSGSKVEESIAIQTALMAFMWKLFI